MPLASVARSILAPVTLALLWLACLTADRPAEAASSCTLFESGHTDLLGRSEFITDAQMQAFADFTLQVTYPPNPIRALDNALTTDQQAGRDFLFNNVSCFSTAGTCAACHVLDRQGNAPIGVTAPGFFGTDGRYPFDLETEAFKTPHLRNAYQKVGMFGMADNPFFLGPDDHMGNQVRGLVFNNEGGLPTIFRFVSSETPDMGFNQSPGTPGGFPPGPEGERLKRHVDRR